MIPGWGNNEDQTYVDSEENIFSSNGCLFGVPTFNEGVDLRARIFLPKTYIFVTELMLRFLFQNSQGWLNLMLPEYKRYGNWPASGK